MTLVKSVISRNQGNAWSGLQDVCTKPEETLPRAGCRAQPKRPLTYCCQLALNTKFTTQLALYLPSQHSTPSTLRLWFEKKPTKQVFMMKLEGTANVALIWFPGLLDISRTPQCTAGDMNPTFEFRDCF